MGTKRLTRRDFLKAAGTATAMAAVGAVPLELFAFDKRLVRYPEKTDLLLLTSRPPQLEMPPRLFRELIGAPIPKEAAEEITAYLGTAYGRKE